MPDNWFHGYRNSRGANANQPGHHTQAFGNNDSEVPDRAGKPEPNFLDLALEELGEDSDDEWEEVSCPTSIAVDRPLIAAQSGFTLPIRGKRSKFLTLEVVEDWQPSTPPSASHAGDPHTVLHEDLEHRLVQELVGEQDDSLEADLQLEVELAEGLANLDTLVPGPSRQPRSRISNRKNCVADASSRTRLPAHLKLEVVEQPSPARTSMKGRGKMTDREPSEWPRKIGEHANPPRAFNDQPTRKPTVSFKKKATELARSTGRLLAPSKPLPPRKAAVTPSSSTTGGPSSTLKVPPHPRTQFASTSDSLGPVPQLFTPKGFSGHVQDLRERRTETTLRQFNDRYGGIIVEHARRDLTDLMSGFTSTGLPETPKATQPAKRRQVRRTTDGERISGAQAQAEEVMKICRSAKSYIVDMAAFRRRELPTAPEPQHPAPTIALPSSWSSSIRPEKTTSEITSQRVSKQPVVSSPIPQLPSTSLGSVPQGLKFTRKQRPAPEPGEIVEPGGRIASSERGARGSRPVSASRTNGLRVMDAPKRRREDLGREPEVSSPWKKPRLGHS